MFADLTEKKVIEIIEEFKLQDTKKLIKYIEKNPLNLEKIEMYQLASYANNIRKGEKPSYIETNLLNSIKKNLPSINKRTIEITDPYCGVGIFLPILLEKYELSKAKINFTFMDNDKDTIDVARALCKMLYLKKGRNVSFKVSEFLRKRTLKADLLISNFPYYRSSYNTLRKQFPGLVKGLPGVQSIASLYLKKALVFAKYLVVILPKNFLFANEFHKHRAHLSRRNIDAIIDLDTKGFVNQQFESILLFAQTDKKLDLSNNTEIYNVKQERSHLINQRFMTSATYPNWVLYRNTFFNSVAKSMYFNAFKPSRQVIDKLEKNQSDDSIWVIQPFNITENNKLIHTENDTYVQSKNIKPNTNVAKNLNKKTYILNINNQKIQVLEKPVGTAISDKLFLLEFDETKFSEVKFDNKYIKYFNSSEFFDFYQLATNYSSKSLTIDTNTIFYFGLKEDESIKNLTSTIVVNDINNLDDEIVEETLKDFTEDEIDEENVQNKNFDEFEDEEEFTDENEF